MQYTYKFPLFQKSFNDFFHFSIKLNRIESGKACLLLVRGARCNFSGGILEGFD